MGNQQTTRETVPIANSVLHLMLSGQTDQAIKKIQDQGSEFKSDEVLNFRGDTLMHYACCKNDMRLVEYLIARGTVFDRENKEKQKPIDLTQKQQIKILIRKTSSLSTETSLKCLQRPKHPQKHPKHPQKHRAQQNPEV